MTDQKRPQRGGELRPSCGLQRAGAAQHDSGNSPIQKLFPLDSITRLGDGRDLVTHTARELTKPADSTRRVFLWSCRTARRPVDGVVFVPTFFGAFDATDRVKREAHRCSKRL